MHTFLTAVAGVGVAFSALLGGHHLSSTTPPERNEVQFHASSTASTSANIGCVAAAVAARETSIDVSISSQTQAISAAYSARASALAAAYAGSDAASVRASVKTAWTTFAASVRVAQKSWKNGQQSAWTVFRTALKACGAGAGSVSDLSNASLDATGGD